MRAKSSMWSGAWLLYAVACGGGSEGDDANDGTGTEGLTSSPTSASGDDDGGPEGDDDDGDDGPGTTGEPTTSPQDDSGTSAPADDSSSGDTGPRTGTCDNPGFLVCEDFEGAGVGEFPADWDLRPSGVWGGNGMGITDEFAAHGGQAFRLDSGGTGAQWLMYQGDISQLQDGHYGRMFFRMGTPIPWPDGGVIHADLFEARGNWEGSTHQVRWAAIENSDEQHNWGYNVQTSNAGEFIHETSYIYSWSDDWQCIEWHHDQGEQHATLWVDGEEILDITADDDPELPTFDDISVGWANYQEASPQFVVYIDEVVLDDERVGCEL
jgi:hypothetical protein